ncbi:PKD domain-containing protein [Hymenobacter sp. RP-2-7]|uniref:PKD domain-containing protein n=1 Tax=Hymenobacter polaris TaxID=2682546 RepID=A0A7Y0AD58_9BACT|nr:PKD domain-containing protein [Hymenobacter polaris]NML64895.1 PKD domain-containing protein [Hymenobacter polaris]
MEFSPDGSRLYADTVGGHEIWQYNLLAGTPAAIAASKQRIPITTRGELNDLQLGPDGNIYVSAWDSHYLARLTNVNASAAAVRYEERVVDLQGATCQFALPRGPNDLNLPPVVVTNSGTVSASAVTCAGEPVLFQSSLSPFVTAASYAWDFGDPDAGGANQAAGQAPSHTYTQAGTYAVRLRVTSSSGQVFETGQTVQVLPLPRIAWPADTTLCAGGQYKLSPGPQPAGTTYRWQDGSTTSGQTIIQAGQYQVRVTSPTGCTTQAQITVSFADCPSLLPNIILPAGDNAANAHFALRGLNASDWDLTLFNRWGREIHRQEHYDNSWAAAGQSAGLYYYFLYNPTTGQRLRGWVEVVK